MNSRVFSDWYIFSNFKTLLDNLNFTWSLFFKNEPYIFDISDCIYILHTININEKISLDLTLNSRILNFGFLFAGWDPIQLQRFMESHTVSVWSRLQTPGCLYLPGPNDNRWPEIDERCHNNRHGKATFQKIHGCVYFGWIRQSHYCALWCACCT